MDSVRKLHTSAVASVDALTAAAYAAGRRDALGEVAGKLDGGIKVSDLHRWVKAESASDEPA